MANENRNGTDGTALIINVAADEAEEFGTVVVTAIADQLGIDPAAMPPLREQVDPELLADLRDRHRSSKTALSFEYLGYDVVVTSDGVIELRPFP